MTETQKEAERMAAIVAKLADFLPKKVAAYGAAHLVQAEIWKALLAPYLVNRVLGERMQYHLPPELVAFMPRLTRCLDRICRIVANPAVDPMGENPWMDLAGDAIAGASLARKLAEGSAPATAGAGGGGGASLVMADGLPMKVPMMGGDEWAKSDPSDPNAGLRRMLAALEQAINKGRSHYHGWDRFTQRCPVCSEQAEAQQEHAKALAELRGALGLSDG